MSAAAAFLGVQAVQQGLNQIKASFNAIIDTLKNGFDKFKNIVQETVAAFRPFEVEMFNRAIKDLQAVFGSMFLPIIKSTTAVIRQIADYFYSLSEASKSLIGGFVKFTLVIGGLTAAFITISGVVSAILVPIAAIAVGFMGLWIALSPILVPLSLVAAAFAGLTAILIGANWSNIVDGIGAIIDGLTAVGEYILSALQPAWDVLKESLSQLYDAFVELFEALKPAIVTHIMILASMIVGAVTIMAAALNWFVNELMKTVRIITMMVRTLSAGWVNLELPESGPKKSAFGLGQHGGSVTDPVAAFKMMQEEVLKNAGVATTKEDQALEANKKTAENTSKLVELLSDSKNDDFRTGELTYSGFKYLFGF